MQERPQSEVAGLRLEVGVINVELTPRRFL